MPGSIGVRYSALFSVQESLFDTTREKNRAVTKALDSINNKWGEWTIYPALMYGREKEVIDRIAFGGVKDLEEDYATFQASTRRQPKPHQPLK